LLVCSGFTEGKADEGIELAGEHLLLVDTPAGTVRRLFGSASLRRTQQWPYFGTLTWKLLDFDRDRGEAVVWDRINTSVLSIRLEDGTVTRRHDLQYESVGGRIDDVAYSARWHRLAYTQERDGDALTFVANDDWTDARLIARCTEGMFEYGLLNIVSRDVLLDSGMNLLIIDHGSGKAARLPTYCVASCCDDVLLVSKWVDPRAYRWLDRSPPDTYRLTVDELRTLLPMQQKQP
jgi:hypothetical protein